VNMIGLIVLRPLIDMVLYIALGCLICIMRTLRRREEG
jgi:hypothetical protein